MPNSESADADREVSGRGWRPSVLHVAFLIPWIGLVLGSRRPVRDNSFLWHVTAGEVQLDAGRVLTTDPFSYTAAGLPWRTQSWAADILYARLDGWFGLGYVPWMMIGVFGLTITAVMVAVHRLTRNTWAVAFTGVATVWVGFIYLNPRPVLFSYLLIALVVLVLGAPRLRWTLPIIILTWAMVHGSFVIGIGLVVLDAWRHRRFRAGVGWGVGLAAVASITAHGLGVWVTLIRFLQSGPALDLITEWAPPDLLSIGLLPVLPGLLLMLVGAIRGRISETDLWIIGPMLFLAFGASRSVLPAWLVLVPLMAVGFATLRLTEIRMPGRAVNLGILPLLAAAPFLLPHDRGIDPVRFPVAGAECVDTDRRLFHDDVTGGFLIYAHHPDLQVFVDDRAELFGEERFREVLEVRNGGPQWNEILDREDVDQVLLAVDAPLIDDLAAEGWKPRFEDDNWVLMDRTSTEACEQGGS